MTCFLDPTTCATAWLSSLPWLWITLGLIVGALVGRYGAALLIVGALLVMRLKPSRKVPSDEIWPHPDNQPRKRHRPF